MRRKIDKEFINAMSKDPGNWRGPFYYNRRDPRLMVPKLHPSMGWTLNFASPYAYLVMVALAAVLIISAVLL